MNQLDLLSKLEKVEKFATTSKINRFLYHPLRYLTAILFAKILARLGEFNYEIRVKTFWGHTMHILLPSSIDIFLSGGKTHDSEIRLVKFLIKELKSESGFLDVGAHYGYYSLLASSILEAGKVYAVEPTSKSFTLLRTNCRLSKNIEIFNCALTDKDGPIEFYEFPSLYSEYNTLEVDNYSYEDWFPKNQVKKHIIPGKKGDTLIASFDLKPTLIKIDVEGAEDSVLRGLHNYISKNSPIIIMEFASSIRENSNHNMAHQFLVNLGYQPFFINQQGELSKIEVDLNAYMSRLGLESDNIVYKKEK